MRCSGIPEDTPLLFVQQASVAGHECKVDSTRACIATPLDCLQFRSQTVAYVIGPGCPGCSKPVGGGFSDIAPRDQVLLKQPPLVIHAARVTQAARLEEPHKKCSALTRRQFTPGIVPGETHTTLQRYGFSCCLLRPGDVETESHCVIGVHRQACHTPVDKQFHTFQFRRQQPFDVGSGIDPRIGEACYQEPGCIPAPVKREKQRQQQYPAPREWRETREENQQEDAGKKCQRISEHGTSLFGFEFIRRESSIYPFLGTG